MAKELNDMSLEELWELFPIVLTEHRPCWKEWFAEEAEELEALLASDIPCKISHIGSTAVPDIWAKPIVDILIELPNSAAIANAKERLSCNGYIRMSKDDFNKGYTPQGFADRVFHVHLRLMDDADEVLFRDYLIEHPDVAREYEALKFSLWKKYEHDRDAYTQAKSGFVKRCTDLAKKDASNTNSDT